MKIAISANTSWNLINFRLKLMKALRSEGHEVIAIAPTDDSSEQIKAEGFRFIPLHRLSRKGSNPYRDFQLKNEYEQIFAQERFDAVLLYTIKPVIYGNLAKRKMNMYSIATITGLGYTFLNKGLRPAVAKKLYKLALKHCDQIFFQNSDDLNLFENSKILPEGIAGVINGSGIDTVEIKPNGHTRYPNKISMLFVGRMLIDKGVRELLYAFKKLASHNKEVYLTLVGGMDSDNPSMIDHAEFRELCNHPRVEYLGERNDVVDIMQTSDIVVLPSYREGIPRVLLEAMSLAKPIVTTDVPGCRQVLVDGVNGLICEARSEEALYDAMNAMVQKSDNERIEMGNQGRIIAQEKFDQKIISQVYISLLNDM